MDPVTVVINRGNGKKETIKGHIKQRGNRFLKVVHDNNKEIGEWFAIKSFLVRCYPGH